MDEVTKQVHDDFMARVQEILDKYRVGKAKIVVGDISRVSAVTKGQSPSSGTFDLLLRFSEEAEETPFPPEDVAGIPLGLSRDYPRLPVAMPLRLIQCTHCYAMYLDATRIQSDGVKCQSIWCEACREKGRAVWIKENAEKGDGRI